MTDYNALLTNAFYGEDVDHGQIVFFSFPNSTFGTNKNNLKLNSTFVKKLKIVIKFNIRNKQNKLKLSKIYFTHYLFYDLIIS